MENLNGTDLQKIWHPFRSAKTKKPPKLFVKGEGVFLYDEQGTPFIDAVSSWWVNLHGHAHPYIIKKITEQAQILEHLMFADFTHKPAIEFADRLLKYFPTFSKIFYSDNGSTAVEIALKMAIQYWFNQKKEKKTIIALKGGYHGDTFGAMSLGKNLFTIPFNPYLFDVIAIDPFDAEALSTLKNVLKKGNSACFIYEPLIQGVSGMHIYSKEVLMQMMKLCQEYECLLIADEVMTGFGRTDHLFASHALSIQPDIIAFSKGITGGFLPLGATICREKIFQAFNENTFFHGHSYTGNPLACQAALASLDLLELPSCGKARIMIGESHTDFCKNKHPLLKRLTSLGTILVVEYHSPLEGYLSPIRDLLIDHFYQNNIIVRPFGNVLYITPPYCITEEQLQQIYQTIESSYEIISQSHY